MIDKLFFMFKALRREVYRKDLRTAYKDWLEERSIENDTTLMDMMNNLSEEEYFEAMDKAKINDDALINKLFKESFRGLTEEEVESYKRSSDLFREFMETEGFNYKYNKNGKPKYVTYKSKNHKDASGNLDLSETLKRASNEELDNALIDFIYNTLTSYEGSLLMMRQGTYRDVKKSSRIERILHNRGALESFIEKYGADNIQEKLNKSKELDDIYEEDATPRSPMDIMYWADNHRNLMDGNDLIGMLAVSSSSHYKLQFLNLKLKEDYIIRLNGKELYELDRVYSPITKKRIGELCAQLQAASPDNGKDPCLGDMNINPKTVDLACLLVRLGVDLTDVGMILNSQEVLNFTYESDGSQEKPKIDKDWNLDTAKLAEIKAYITLGKYDLVDPSFIVNFKEWFKNLEKVAKDMTAMNPVLRSDSPNGALKSDFAEAIRQILILKDLKENVLKDGDFSIKGFNELIDFDINATDMSRDELFDKFIKNKIPRLQAIFSLGFTSAVPVIQERLSDFSEASIERLALFMEQTGMDLKKSRNTTIIKQILNEYNAFLLTKDKIFSGEEESSLLEKRNYYIHDFPIKFNAILTVKDNEGFYKYNNIKNLPAIKRISNKTDKGIKMDNIGKISPETRKWYTESFDQLLNMGNDVSAEEKKVAQDLAVDLLLYAFFDNGLTFRYNSFSNFFSSLYMTSIPGLVDAYRMAENLTRSTNNYDERFMAQFLINHPKYVAKVSSKTIKREGNLIYPIKSEGFYPDGVYTPDKKRYREFIALGRGNDITIFRRVIDLSGDDKLAYEKVEINNTGTLYYDGNTNSSDIDYTKVKARGNVKVKLDRLLKEKIIKEKTTVPTQSSNKISLSTTGYKKEDPQKHPDIDYIFTENAEAYLASNKVALDVVPNFPNQGKTKLGVSDMNGTNQAGIRNTQYGTILVNGKQVENPKAYDPAYNNPNAYGIVVKKYQQNANGRFVAAEGQFQDTEEDFKLFVSLNEDMFQRLSKSKNVKTVFPTQIGLGKAALPKRFAKWLQAQLLERFGINSTIKENQRSDYDGYGLELTSVYTTVSTPKASKWKWGVTSNNGFEVSTAAKKPGVLGDSRFSALNAKFKSGTIIDGVNVGGRTIEDVYQSVIKKSRKGQAPSKGSRLNLNPTSTSEEKRLKFLKEVKAEYGNPLTYSNDEGIITVNFENGSLRVIPFAGSIEDLSGKSLGNKDINYFIGALKAIEDLAGGYEDFSYTEGYLPLWQEWARQNPELIDELRIKAKGKTLTDRFANTRVSQARALADILNSTEQKDDSDEPLVRDNFNDNDEFLPNDSGSNDSPIDLNDFKSDDDDIKDKVVGAASSDDNYSVPIYSNISFNDNNVSVSSNIFFSDYYEAKGKQVNSEEKNRFVEGAANSMTDWGNNANVVAAANSMTEEETKRAKAIENTSKDTGTPQNLEEIETSDEIKKQCPPQ